jgi:hypothetical protein
MTRLYEVSALQRSTLVFLVCPAFVFWNPYSWMCNWYFVTSMFFFFALALAFNVPRIVVALHAKPIYMCDLEDEQDLNPVERYRFQKRFLWTQQAWFIFSLPLIADYYVNRYQQQLNRQNVLEVMVITYGALCMIGSAASYTGSLMLWIIDAVKKLSASRPSSMPLCPVSPDCEPTELVLNQTFIL